MCPVRSGILAKLQKALTQQNAHLLMLGHIVPGFLSGSSRMSTQGKPPHPILVLSPVPMGAWDWEMLGASLFPLQAAQASSLSPLRGGLVWTGCW